MFNWSKKKEVRFCKDCKWAECTMSVFLCYNPKLNMIYLNH